MQALKNTLKNPVFWIFLVILSGAIFVRAYHFNEWLYFKMDQSRDAFLTSNAVTEGLGALPLLGPRVGAVHLSHGLLRLGPIFYYFQYAAGELTGSIEPYVFAYPELFFSILALPLLYAFARLALSKKHALMVVAMYAFSFLVIEYSRFSWNPNSIQFFGLLTFFGLLKFMNTENTAWRRVWLALWAFGLAIGSQLHFFGFFSLIGISGLMILWHYRVWEKAPWQALRSWRVWREILALSAIFITIFGVLYTPVIISDVIKHGENSKNFIEALTAKPTSQSIIDKFAKGTVESADYYCLLTTSYCYSGGPSDHPFPVIVTIIILMAGLVIAWRKSMDMRRTMMERDFHMLLIIWVAVFFILCIPVAYQLRPRFFIIVFAVPFLLLGTIFRFLEDRFQRRSVTLIPFALMSAILAANMYGTYEWFHEQAKAQVSRTETKRTLILKVRDGVTFGQIAGVADFMYRNHTPGNTLYFYVKPEHVNPIRYALFLKNDPALVFTPMKINENPHAEYFAIERTGSGLGKVTKKFGDIFTVMSSEQHGQLTVYKLDVEKREVSENFHISQQSSEKSDRLFWQDIFGGNDTIKNIDFGE